MFRKLFVGTFILLFSFELLASFVPSIATYHGRIILPSKEPLEAPNVTFTLKVISSGPEACILYEETQVVDMTDSQGLFSLAVGAGHSTSADPGMGVLGAINNSTEKTGLNCNSGSTYTPQAGHGRKLRITFDYPDSTGAVTISPDVNVSSTPYAMYASSLEGLGKNEFLQVNTEGTANLTQAHLNELFTDTNHPLLMSAIDGSHSSYAKASDLPVVGGVLDLTSGGVIVQDTPTTGDSAINKNYSDSKLGGLNVQSDLSTTLSASSGDGFAMIWDQSTQSFVARAPAGDHSKLPMSGGTMTGDIMMSSADNANIEMNGNDILNIGDISNIENMSFIGTGQIDLNDSNLVELGYVTIMPERTLHLGHFTTSQEVAYKSSLVPADAGKIWYNSTESTFKFWDGTQSVDLKSMSDSKLPTSGGTMTGDIQLNSNNLLGAKSILMSGVSGVDHLDMNSQFITNTGHITMADQHSLRLGSYTDSEETTLLSSLGAGDIGSVWYNKDSNELKMWTNTGVAQTFTSLGNSAGSAIDIGSVPNCSSDEKLQMSPGPLYSWSCASDAGDVESIVAGDGLIGTDLTGANPSLQVNVDDASLEISSDALKIKNLGVLEGHLANDSVGSNKIIDGSVTTNDLNDSSVSTSKIQDGSVLNTKLATDAVTGSKVLDGSIQSVDIGANAVTSSHIATGAVVTTSLATGSVTGVKILDGTIVSADIAANTITSSNIASGAIGATELAADSVTGAKILDASVGSDDIANSSITSSHLAPGSIGSSALALGSVSTTQILDATIQSADIAVDTVQASNIAENAVGASELAADAVETVHIKDGSVTAAKLGAGSITSTQILDATIQSADIAVDTVQASNIAENAVGASELAADAVETVHIKDGSVTAAKLGAGSITSTQILDATIQSVDIAADTIQANDIANNAVGVAELADNSVDSGALQANSVTATKIANSAVGSSKIAINSISSDKIIDRTIQSADIALDSIASSLLAENSVESSELADDAVDTAAIQDGSVTTAKLATDAITSDKIADDAVGADQVANNSIGSDQIINGSIESADLAGDILNATHIASGAIGSSELADNSVDTGALQNSSVVASKIGAGAVELNHLANDSVNSSKIVNGSIVASDIAADTIMAAQLAANSVSASELADNSVASSNIINASIVSEDVANNAITAAHIAANAVTSTELADNSVSSAKITNGSIVSADIASNTISAANIATNGVGASELADNSVDTNALQNNSVTAAKVSANILQNGGNSVGADLTLGTNDNNGLAFETNNSARMTINNSGQVGVGVTTPKASLDVSGQIRPSMGVPTVNPSGNNIDFVTGNTQYSTFSACPGNVLTVNLHSMLEGGSYSLVIIAPSGCVIQFVGTSSKFGESDGVSVSSFKYKGGQNFASTGNPIVYSFLRANNFVFTAQVLDFL